MKTSSDMSVPGPHQLSGEPGLDLLRKLHAFTSTKPEYANGLPLSDTRFIPAEDLVVAVDPTLKQLCPFARNARNEHWCWWLGHKSNPPAPVLFGEQFGGYVWYADSFDGCLFRLLIEEFSSTWLVEVMGGPDEVSRILRTAATDLTPLLPERRSQLLLELIGRPFKEHEDGTWGFVSPEEAEEIIRRELAHPRLDKIVTG